MCAWLITTLGVYLTRFIPEFSNLNLLRFAAHVALPLSGGTTSNLISASLESLIPHDLSPERFNNEFLQCQANSANAIFAVARVSRLLDTPNAEVENLTFGVLSPNVQANVQVNLFIPTPYVP